MKIVAGIDIGNDSTEVAIGKLYGENIEFLSSSLVSTTGLKGTDENIHGIYKSLKEAVSKCNIDIKDIDLVRINEAAPVIGDVAMETITETIITESTMIGHNPDTPGGVGIGVGKTVMIDKLSEIESGEDVIVLCEKNKGFEEVAETINKFSHKININGAIVKNDDGVLIFNRINKPIPIVDEVSFIEKIPLGMTAAVEVAEVGSVVDKLSNPFGIATLFNLSPEDTKKIVPIARALIGNRSAVVIKTPKGDVKERSIPAGKIIITGVNKEVEIPVEKGAKEIMNGVEKVSSIDDITGEKGTNAGGMLERVKITMAQLTDQSSKNIRIKDLLAVDTFVPQKVAGALAGEYSLENAVGIAAMVKSEKLQMEKIAKTLSQKIEIDVEVGGVEADMAILGALTTPGTKKPLAILDMGAGSTDASIIRTDGTIKSIHLAGAGDMVTMLIDSELGIEDIDLAEDIKKYPLAKAESFFHIRHEDGSVKFFEEQLSPRLIFKVVIVKEGDLIPLNIEHSLEKIKNVRREAKKKVFVTNAIRALKTVSPTNNLRDIEFVVLVGGSALDFEIPQMVTNELSKNMIVAGKANIRGKEGPRNAVATGLVLSNREC
ncbi:MAG: diol dehydratase reactivase subunit alpha [Tissierellales bacterium]|nr:diol dehydratase reactivase subunit alpha [Tissierellales bacterium]